MSKPKDDKDPKAGAEGAEGEAGEGQGGEGAPAKRGLNVKKLALFVGAPLVLLILAGAGAHFMGLTKSLFGGGDTHAAAKPEPKKESVYFNMPEMLVNLNTPGRRPSYLKISVSLELETAKDVSKVEAVMPRIVDNFQTYLRELRVDDLKGSAGLYRLREELLARVNLAAQPARVSDVLFKEMLVQ